MGLWGWKFRSPDHINSSDIVWGKCFTSNDDCIQNLELKINSKPCKGN